MNMVEGKIVHMLTGKANLHEVSVDELRTIAEQQPYFSVIQLLLAKKMKQENHPDYQQQLYKTSLYFPNTHWLHHELNRIEEERDEVEPSEEPVVDSATPSVEALAHEENLQEILAVDEKAPIINLKYELEQEQDQQPAQETGHSTEHATATITPVTNLEESTDIDQAVATEAPEAETITEAEIVVQQPETLPVDESPVTADVNLDAVPDVEAPSALSKLMEEQAKEFNKPVEETATLPVINEPYHTIDYFASQGIKLDRNLPPQDQLDKKVRKFTDWLKHMKKGSAQPVDLGTSPELENVIKDIAENSNEAKEIVTEAMADVLIKQGKTAKAIQLYQKLSELNPGRAAYFISKAEALK